MTHGGYIKGNPKDFSVEYAMDIKTLMKFLRDSQPKSWDKLHKIHGDSIEEKLIKRIHTELDNRGILDVLRKGITDYGVIFSMAYFKPVSGLNPETERLYKMNCLTVTRQVEYSKKNSNRLDMVLSINGLPVATIELKNQFTGQTVLNSIKQYKQDRDPNELLFKFKKRALVHFAVDTDEVFMTTRLSGKDTRFLPFNRGYNNGKGNPPNPDCHRTSYMWEYIWTKDSWMDIIGRFLHIQTEEFKYDGKVIKKEKIVFPRFHQLDAVRKLAADATEAGPGKNYLIQHSAGSGKSNSIAWLAYRLSSLHNERDERIFNSVIVVTDRKVLDQQLQNTIYQFEHKPGVVHKIDKHSDQLAKALEAGGNIIITTMQKFPFVIDKIGELPSRTYAVIVDEAHSSQGGEAAKTMKEVLSITDLEEAAKEEALFDDLDDPEDKLRELISKSMLARGRQKNLSFFAFTATPKAKTLEVFGVRDASGKPVAFHLYSMRQAIEEGFIMDVLKNYTTYKSFFELSKAIEDDPLLNKKKAARAIARFMSLHPHNLSQKTEIMIEHFRQVTMKKIGGKAKAMVITPSRLHVVRYKREFDTYIKEKGYSDIKVLVAFSGKVSDGGVEFTEPEINRMGEKELPDKFNTDEYQLLLVANKYQTGYDQPLLHTMYIDKVLSGVKAVQTMSRLNRICPGKEDTFILDFANEREVILESFRPYYEQTYLDEAADPNRLYDLKSKIDGTQIIWQRDIDGFCQILFSGKNKQTEKDHAKLNALIDPAVERFKAIGDDNIKDDFKRALAVFIRAYLFLSQIMPFTDIELEKFYTYSRYLLNKLPKRDAAEDFKLNDEVALEYYRLQKMSEGDMTIDGTDGTGLNSMSEAGLRRDKEEKAPLSEIIELLNDKFGTDFTDADRLYFQQIEEALVEDEKLAQQARSNDIDNFKYGFEDVFMEKLIDRMEQNEDIMKKILDNKEFGDLVKDIIMRSVYKRLQKER
ncbi:MAG: type I restriction endonuclease [Candidatus Eremiobacterota bacterium]